MTLEAAGRAVVVANHRRRRSDPSAGPPGAEALRVSRPAGDDTVDLAVSAYGRGDTPVTVLVHGYPDSSTVWDPVVAALRTDPDRRVVTYDVRGAGASTAPQDVAAYRVEHLVADLVAVVDATSPGRPVHLVGHDWGSIQSWAAVCDPDAAGRVASFTSISGPPLPHVVRWARAQLRAHPRALLALLDQQRRSAYVAAFQLPLVAPAVWRAGLGRAWPASLARREAVVPDGRWPGPGLTDDAVAGVNLYRANVGRASLDAEETPTTAVPTQVVVPLGDRFIRPDLLDGIDGVAPGAAVRRVEGGHWIVRAQPQRVAGWIDDHIRLIDPDLVGPG